MKVTLEPTEQHALLPNSTVTISYPTDDLDCEEAVKMVLDALVAWGYTKESVFEAEATIIALQQEVKRLSDVRFPDKKHNKRS